MAEPTIYALAATAILTSSVITGWGIHRWLAARGRPPPYDAGAWVGLAVGVATLLLLLAK